MEDQHHGEQHVHQSQAQPPFPKAVEHLRLSLPFPGTVQGQCQPLPPTSTGEVGPELAQGRNGSGAGSTGRGWAVTTAPG